MIMLVHPSGGGNTPARRRHCPSPTLSLTADEARHVHTAIRGVARTYGGIKALATALGVKEGTLASKRPSAGLAVAVARIAGLSLDAMLTGRLTDAGTCPACGGKRVGGAS